MTNTTGTQTATVVNTYSTVEEVLALHGIASIDDARAQNVAFGCFGCGSISEVTANSEEERQMQASLIEWDCHPDADNFAL